MNLSKFKKKMYSWVSNRGRVWNNHIGWTFTLKRINVGCGIKVLGGNFSKMLIVVDRMFPSNVWNLIKWFKTSFNIMKNQHFLLAKGWKIAKICVFQLRRIENKDTGWTFSMKSINVGYEIRA